MLNPDKDTAFALTDMQILVIFIRTRDVAPKVSSYGKVLAGKLRAARLTRDVVLEVISMLN